MTKEQEEAIKRCEKLIEVQNANWIGISNQSAIKNVLNMLKEKDKQIDLMGEYMEENMDEYQLDEIYAKQYNCNGMERNWTRGKEKEVKDIKQYFEKLAREKGE